jgi:uncharacterized protein
VSESLSQADIAHVREGYRLFREGDPAFLDHYEPDATLVFPESLPKGGTYGSPWEALEFWNHTGELFADPRPEPEELIRDGDRLVVLGHFHGCSKATGATVASRFAHWFELPDPERPLSELRYTSLEVIVDTAAVLSVLAEEDRQDQGHRGRVQEAGQAGHELRTSRPMSANLSPEDVEGLREGYRRFRDHDPAFMDRYSHDATFVFPESLPAGGVYQGPWEALEFMTTVNERVDDPHPEPDQFVRDGDRIVVLGTWHAVVPTTGRHASARVTHAFRFSGGDRPLQEQQATSFELIADTASFAAALAEADRG